MNNTPIDQLTPTQHEFLEIILLNDVSKLAEEFMLIHDIALYHSDYSINEDEKTALYQIKHLSEILKRISKEI